MPADPVAIPPTPRPRRWQFRLWAALAPRIPLGITRAVARALGRLRPGSRARSWAFRGIAEISWDATARGRYELVFPIWDAAAEWHWDENFTGLGFDPVYHGHDGIRRSAENWNQNWSEVRFEVREILDGGDTLVLRMLAIGRGRSSGAPTEMPFTSVARLDPLMVRFHNFLDHDAALQEAGFDA